jgi:two-component system phosphate regulon response regulator PhoB
VRTNAPLFERPSGVRKRPASLTDSVPTILVVEDEYDQRNLVVEALWTSGFAAQGVSTLGEARAELEYKRPLLVIVDRRLPDGDGIAFVHELRANPSTASIPVLAVTAAAGRRDVDDAFVAGCDAFLSKPCSTDALIDAVQRLVRTK